MNNNFNSNNINSFNNSADDSKFNGCIVYSESLGKCVINSWWDSTEFAPTKGKMFMVYSERYGTISTEFYCPFSFLNGKLRTDDPELLAEIKTVDDLLGVSKRMKENRRKYNNRRTWKR